MRVKHQNTPIFLDINETPKFTEITTFPEYCSTFGIREGISGNMSNKFEVFTTTRVYW